MSRTLVNAILLLLVSAPVFAQPDYDATREQLEDEAFFSQDGRHPITFDLLFGPLSLVFDPCEVFGEAIATGVHEAGNPKCDEAPQLSIDGLSEKGAAALIAATESYQTFNLYLMEEQARRLVAVCESGETVPIEIARNIGDIYESQHQMALEFYQATISNLTANDIELLEEHNRTLLGVPHPAGASSLPALEETLASRFPRQYRDQHFQNCTDAVQNKDLPFKRFRREPTGTHCKRSTLASDGVNTTRSAMASDCWTYEYYAQQPEREGDKEVEPGS